MGFLDKFASFFLTEENTETSLLPNANNSGDIDGEALEDSLTLKLANLKQKLTLIEQALPDKVDKLKDEINDLENQIITSSDSASMMAIENEYLNLEDQFNKLEPLCKQFLVRKELKILQKQLDSLFLGKLDEECPISNSLLSELEDGLHILEGKKSMFNDENLRMYIADLIKAEYRLKCCKMLCKDSTYSSNFKNLFADIPRVKYAFYGEFIKDDYNLALETLDKLTNRYKLENLGSAAKNNLSNCQSLIDYLESKLSEDFIDNFVVDKVFKDDAFVNKFIKLHKGLKDEKAHFSQRIQNLKEKELREIEQKEQKRIETANEEKLKKEKAEQEEKEKELMKSASAEDLTKKIKQIDASIFDIEKSYIEIYEYELKVAQARGLLSPINLLQIQDMETRRISKSDIGAIIKKAEKHGINYLIFRDIDDCETDNCLLATVKGDSGTLITPISSAKSFSNSRKIEGTYSYAFSKYFLQETGGNSKIIFNYSHSACFINDSYTDQNLGRTQLLNAYNHIQELSKDSHNLDNIAVSLELPYLRSIIPILEALSNEGITYYFPPIDTSTKKLSATKKIYINRNDLETYKEKVHPKISSKELGDITIGDETIDLTNEILDGCNIPLIEQEAKEKEQQKKYKSLTEQDMRQAIKKLDDDSYDVTDSYKDILRYEKDVAREKGLLTLKNEMATNDINFMRIKKEDLWRFMQNTKAQGVRCSFLLDVDENNSENILVAFSKAQKDKIKLPDIIRKSKPSDYIEFPGKYSNSFLAFWVMNYTTNYIAFYNNSIYYYYKSQESDVKAIVKKLHDSINSLPTTDKDIEDIKVPLQLSYLRPLVPILEKLKEAGIEYYIPPFDDSTNKYEPTKKIYIDRKDLAVYKEKVHPQISNLENGVVSIGYENIKIANFILDGCHIPFEQLR